MTVRVQRLFHPDLLVPDLGEAEEWFLRAFGRESVRLEGTEWAHKMRAQRPGSPVDYCTFTSLAEVLIESIDPKRHIVDGEHGYPLVAEPTLTDLAWYVEGLDEVYQELLRRGIGIERHRGSDPTAVPPRARFADLVLFWTNPDDTGLRYELYDPRGGSMDLRRFPGWTPLRYLDPNLAGDPLGLLSCANHTVLTQDPERALRFTVEVLGGEVIHRGRSRIIQGDSVYVALGDGVIEYATPEVGDSHEMRAWEQRAPHDTYYAMTFVVSDLDRASEHLLGQGMTLTKGPLGDTLITNPETSLGIPWGFTAHSIPGDPRTERHT